MYSPTAPAAAASALLTACPLMMAGAASGVSAVGTAAAANDRMNARREAIGIPAAASSSSKPEAAIGRLFREPLSCTFCCRVAEAFSCTAVHNC
jgi:hypothetical protein